MRRTEERSGRCEQSCSKHPLSWHSQKRSSQLLCPSGLCASGLGEEKIRKCLIHGSLPKQYRVVSATSWPLPGVKFPHMVSFPQPRCGLGAPQVPWAFHHHLQPCGKCPAFRSLGLSDNTIYPTSHPRLTSRMQFVNQCPTQHKTQIPRSYGILWKEAGR